MRNRFSELVAAGIARSPIRDSISDKYETLDEMTRSYNKIWAGPTFTTMSLTRDGRHVITGEYINDSSIAGKARKNDILFSSCWGGVDFRPSGYNCLNDFIKSWGCEIIESYFNTQACWEVVPRAKYDMPAEYDECPPCTDYALCGSLASVFPCEVRNNIEKVVFECAGSSIDSVCRALNESTSVPGVNWAHNGTTCGCVVNNNVLVFELCGASKKVNMNKSLKDELGARKLGDLHLVDNGHYLSIDSDDPKWKRVLSKCKYNKFSKDLLKQPDADIAHEIEQLVAIID